MISPDGDPISFDAKRNGGKKRVVLTVRRGILVCVSLEPLCRCCVAHRTNFGEWTLSILGHRQRAPMFSTVLTADAPLRWHVCGGTIADSTACLYTAHTAAHRRRFARLANHIRTNLCRTKASLV